MAFLKLLESAKSGLSNDTTFVNLRHVVDGVGKDVDLFSRDFDFRQIQQTYEFHDRTLLVRMENRPTIQNHQYPQA
jgi:hypothetical protein